MLREANNFARIEGLLLETDLNYGSFVKDGKTIETIYGQIKVLVEQVVNGKPESYEIPVRMFSQKYTKAGTINPSYASIEDVKNNFHSVAACGNREEADKVRMTGKVTESAYYTREGKLVSYPQIGVNFVSHVKGEFKPEATFSMDFAVSSIDYVTDADGVEVEPKKLQVTAIVPRWGGKVDVLKMYATSPNVINAITSYWEPDGTYKANGRLNFCSKTETILEEVDFGEPIERQRTTSVSELVITGGSQTALNIELAYDPDDLIVAMKERKAYLDSRRESDMTKQKGRAQTPAPKTSHLAGEDLGF